MKWQKKKQNCIKTFFHSYYVRNVYNFFFLSFFYPRLFRNENKYPCWLTLIRTKGVSRIILSSVFFFSVFFVFSVRSFPFFQIWVIKSTSEWAYVCESRIFSFFFSLFGCCECGVCSCLRWCRCGSVLCEGCASMRFFFYFCLSSSLFTHFWHFSFSFSLPFYHSMSMSLLHFRLCVCLIYFGKYFFFLLCLCSVSVGSYVCSFACNYSSRSSSSTNNSSSNFKR